MGTADTFRRSLGGRNALPDHGGAMRRADAQGHWLSMGTADTFRRSLGRTHSLAHGGSMRRAGAQGHWLSMGTADTFRRSLGGTRIRSPMGGNEESWCAGALAFHGHGGHVPPLLGGNALSAHGGAMRRAGALGHWLSMGTADTFRRSLGGQMEQKKRPPRGWGGRGGNLRFYSLITTLRRANFFASGDCGTVRVTVSNPLGLFLTTVTPGTFSAAPSGTL
jgi:hypothetical protein